VRSFREPLSPYRELFGVTGSRSILQIGQVPGRSDTTAGCIGQTYCPGVAGCASCSWASVFCGVCGSTTTCREKAPGTPGISASVARGLAGCSGPGSRICAEGLRQAVIAKLAQSTNTWIGALLAQPNGRRRTKIVLIAVLPLNVRGDCVGAPPALDIHVRAPGRPFADEAGFMPKPGSTVKHARKARWARRTQRIAFVPVPIEETASMSSTPQT